MVIPPIQDLLVTLLNFINIVLAVVLVIIYGKNLKSIKSNFTLGLFIFSIAFLLENLSNLFWLGTILLAGNYSLTLFQASANLIEMIALLVLVRLSLK